VAASAYLRVYDSHHLQADCRNLRSVIEWVLFTFFTCCKQSRNIEQLGLELSDIFMCFVLQYDTDSWPSSQVDVMLFCDCRDAVRCQATAGTAAAGAVAAS